MTTSFEALIEQVAEQNRELKRKQYELKASNAHLETMAYSDALTGLPNRPMFESTLHTAFDKANAGGMPLAILFVDLDNLKAINDKYGKDSAVAIARLSPSNVVLIRASIASRSKSRSSGWAKAKKSSASTHKLVSCMPNSSATRLEIQNRF